MVGGINNMNRNQVIELLSTIQSLYPNFKVENKTFTVNAWFEMLKDCDYCMIQQGLKVFVKTDKSGFAPSIGQLIDKAQMSHKPSELNELEAWSLVSNALRNGIYKPAEEFTKLPPLVQKAVGSIDNLRHWAESDINTIETVIQSNFIRTYRAVVSQSNDVYKMSDDEKAMIEDVNRDSYKAQIEDKNQASIKSLQDNLKQLDRPKKEARELPTHLKDKIEAIRNGGKDNKLTE